jgi:hypothetical protein
MAKWVFKSATWTPVAVADTAAYTDNGYMGLMGGSTTQMINILEVSANGQATASAPTFLLFGRDSTVQATPTALSTGQSNAALHPSTAALGAAQVAFTASTTKPQRSATLASLSMSYNAFGGIVKWIAGNDGEFTILGNTASLGEASLSAYTGGTPGICSAHILYEPL